MSLHDEIISAVVAGDIEGVRRCLDADPSSIHARRKRTDEPLLYLAARTGNTGLLQLLLFRGASVQDAVEAGFSPLAAAAWNSPVHSAAILISRQAPLDTPDRWGYRPLYAAIWGHNTPMVHFLLASGAEVDIVAAVDLHRTDRVEEILARDAAAANTRLNTGKTVLRQAIGGGPINLPIVRVLLAHGADPNARDAWGSHWTPLHAAAADDFREAVGLLLEHGADPGLRSLEGETPARLAAAKGQPEIIALIENYHGGSEESDHARPHGAAIAERILSQIWGGDIHLGGCEPIREHILRFHVAGAPEIGERPAPATVIVKRARRDGDDPYNPDSTDWNPSWSLLSAWAGVEFLAQLPVKARFGPRFYGGDRESGVLVMEDLGSGQSVAGSLTGGDPDLAELTLVRLARTIGRMHAVAWGRQSDYSAIRQRLGAPERVGRLQNWARPNEMVRRLIAGLGMAGLVPRPGFTDEFAELAAAILHRSTLHTFVHGDLSPDNCLLVGESIRFIDFGVGGFQHAMIDAVYGRMRFPSSGLSARLPLDVAPKMEAAYRSEIILACPQASYDSVFYRGLVHACGYWTISGGYWDLHHIQAPDRTWGLSTWRQRVIANLDSFASVSSQYGMLPAMGRTARDCVERLGRIWRLSPLDLPLYPAFRSHSV